MSTTSNVYLSEYERLKTFQNGWPHTFLSAEVMAKCGFYYTGNNDAVKCPFCNVVVLNWSFGDEPIREHIRSSGSCPFVNGYDVGNIFIGEDPRQIFDLAPGEDVFGSSTKIVASESNQIDSNEPCISYCEPRHLDFITYDSRLASFKDWTSPNIAPAKLAEAGFFFRGIGISINGDEIDDAVTCFHCDESLSGWTKNDDAWEEHAKFSPQCSFIFLLTAFETSRMHQNTVSPFLPYGWLSKATDENRCSVCFEFSALICLNPCAHSICSVCAAAISKCPICRSNIRSLTKIIKEKQAVEPLAIETGKSIENLDVPPLPQDLVDSTTVSSPPEVKNNFIPSWKGFIFMVLVAKFFATAYRISGISENRLKVNRVNLYLIKSVFKHLPLLAVESPTIESTIPDSPAMESMASKEMPKKQITTESQSAIEKPKEESAQSSP